MAALIAAYGAYAFVKRDFGKYMLLQYHFVFFDFEESLALFLLDYVAIFSFFAVLGYYVSKIMRQQQSKSASQ